MYQTGTKLQKVDNATTPMPDLQQFVPWRHQTVIVSKCATINAALFYLNKVVEDNMSRTELEHVVKAQLYEHTGKALNNFDVTLTTTSKRIGNRDYKRPVQVGFLLIAKQVQRNGIGEQVSHKHHSLPLGIG